jgi:choline kinase
MCEKRRSAAALQNASAYCVLASAATFWSAPVFWRFRYAQDTAREISAERFTSKEFAMNVVSEAVILIAGEGSRLREADKTFLKPVAPVLGRPLISYTLDALKSVAINRIHFVVGYQSERMTSQAKQLIPSGMCASFIENREWQKQNGISLLAAAGHVRAPFLLTMGDHLFDGAIFDRLLVNFDPALLNIAVDRKLDSIFDLDDAMKVRTRRNSVTDIGKHLPEFDAIDTGLFVCPLDIFDYLERAKSESGRNDCSLADGIRLMAADEKVQAIDIGESWWQDIDTAQMLHHAEKQITKSRILLPQDA